MGIEVENNVVYGVHSATIFNLSTGLPYEYGLLKVIGDVSWNNQVENVALTGGSNPYPFLVENGAASSEVSFTARQFEPAMQQQFGGAVFTETAASSTGTISSVRNVTGTSVSDAATGIASITVTSSDEGDLKFGAYALKVVSSTTVDLYAYTDLDFNVGTDVDYSTAKSLLVEAGITVSGSDGTTAIADLGLTITGGSGTVSMTVDDTAVFRVVPPHGKIYDFSYGESGIYPDYVGIAFYGQKQADGTRDEMLVTKCKANGLSLAMAEKNFAETEITAIAVQAQSIFTGNCDVVEFRQVRPA